MTNIPNHTGANLDPAMKRNHGSPLWAIVLILALAVIGYVLFTGLSHGWHNVERDGGSADNANTGASSTRQ